MPVVAFSTNTNSLLSARTNFANSAADWRTIGTTVLRNHWSGCSSNCVFSMRNFPKTTFGVAPKLPWFKYAVPRLCFSTNRSRNGAPKSIVCNRFTHGGGAPTHRYTGVAVLDTAVIRGVNFADFERWRLSLLSVPISLPSSPCSGDEPLDQPRRLPVALPVCSAIRSYLILHMHGERQSSWCKETLAVVVVVVRRVGYAGFLILSVEGVHSFIEFYTNCN